MEKPCQEEAICPAPLAVNHFDAERGTVAGVAAPGRAGVRVQPGSRGGRHGLVAPRYGD
jgi:hypothetical protein